MERWGGLLVVGAGIVEASPCNSSEARIESQSALLHVRSFSLSSWLRWASFASSSELLLVVDPALNSSSMKLWKLGSDFPLEDCGDEDMMPRDLNDSTAYANSPHDLRKKKVALFSLSSLYFASLAKDPNNTWNSELSKTISAWWTRMRGFDDLLDPARKKRFGSSSLDSVESRITNLKRPTQCLIEPIYSRQ